MLARVLALLVGLSLVLATLATVTAADISTSGRLQALRPAAVVVVLCLAWVLVNGPVEGRVLWVPLRRHGLTQADLLVVPALAVAALLTVLRLRD